MLTRRAALLAASLTLALGAQAFAAASPEKFTQDAFDRALKSGKPVLVHIAAPWCPICQAQKPALQHIRAEDRFKDLVSFDIDYDTQKDAVRAVGARVQSTIIVYKQGKEAGRLVGESQEEWIEDVVEKVL